MRAGAPGDGGPPPALGALLPVAGDGACGGPGPALGSIVTGRAPAGWRIMEARMTGNRPRAGHVSPLFAFLFALAGLAFAGSAQAASRDELRTFLEVTGFDVAITSMQQGAMEGPGIAGDAPGDFGVQWSALAQRVFDPDLMINRALDMMEAVLPDDLVTHGQDFYASELGQRIVAAENESHVTPDSVRHAEGETILQELGASDPGRIEDYRAMSNAIGGIDASIKAVLEIQYRYLMAAMAAGAIELNYVGDDLRALLAEQIPEMSQNIEYYSLLSEAYAYRDFSDEDMKAYRAALEAPEMRQVYEILNAIQYEIMAERYEALAGELANLAPQQDI